MEKVIKIILFIIQCSLSIKFTMANPYPLDQAKLDMIYSTDLGLSSQCDQARQSDRLKDCVHNGMTNMNQLLLSIDTWYKDTNDKEGARQKIYPAVCCTMKDVKSCVLTITKVFYYISLSIYICIHKRA